MAKASQPPQIWLQQPWSLLPARLAWGRVKAAGNAVFLGARWGKVGWQGGGQRDGFCRAVEGAGGAGTQQWRAGGDWEWAGGFANGLHATATLHEGVFGAPGSEHGRETCQAWWALHVLLLLGSGWLWLWLRGVQTRDASSEPEQGKKRKLPPKYHFVCVWGCMRWHVLALWCILFQTGPSGTTQPSVNVA